MRKKVAITGVGLVTPVGLDAPTTWRNLQDGKSGVGPITLFDARGFTTTIGAEVKGFVPTRWIEDERVLKMASRAHLLALAAAEEALQDASLRPCSSDPERWAICVGAGMMGITFDHLHEIAAAGGPDGLSFDPSRLKAQGNHSDPLAFCRSQSNAGVSLLAHHFGITGYATAVHTACASGGQALGAALKTIRRGFADRVLAGGFDAMLSPLGLESFCLLGAVSPDKDDPHRVSRPFDLTRNGFVLGEGAGFVVLEKWELAKARGAHIYAELAGDGNSLSSYRITDSHASGDGPIQAMQSALRNAGVTAEEVDYINAHGTSTPMNDRGECAAIRAVLGDHADIAAISSTKSCMGHLIAAAGAVEAAVCALAVRDGVAPVNANLTQLDPDCAINIVRGASQRRPVRVAMSNSFGFGGSNNCLVLRRPEAVS